MFVRIEYSQSLCMFVYCLSWLTCSSNTNTNMFVVDCKQFAEITNTFKLFDLPRSRRKFVWAVIGERQLHTQTDQASTGSLAFFLIRLCCKN